MKMRIGLISEDKTVPDQIKKDFSDVHIYYSSNVMDFYQVVGNNKIDAIIFSGGKKLLQEFTSYYLYIRQKPHFKTTPLAVLCSENMINKHPLPDTLVRSYALSGGYFVSLIGFFNAIQDGNALKRLLESARIESLFLMALGNKVPQAGVFKARPATDEEAHSEFLVQHADEISSNLLWLKFSARIMTQGSEGLVQSMKDLKEEEQQQLTTQIIANVFTDFYGEMNNALKDEGALFFNKSDAIPGPEKAPYMKRAKSQGIVFESSFCTFLVEFIRYL